jgi:hypothetical protein
MRGFLKHKTAAEKLAYEQSQEEERKIAHKQEKKLVLSEQLVIVEGVA